MHRSQELAGIVNEPAWIFLKYIRAQKQMLFRHLGQVDSPSGHVPFHPHLPDGQGITQVVCQLKSLKEQTKICRGQAIFERYLP